MDVALRWIEITEAVRRIDHLEQRLLLLPLSLNARAGDDELIRNQIMRIKLDSGLGQPFDREFTKFFRNWKARLAEAEDLTERRAALKWILRKLHTAMSTPIDHE